MTRFAPAALVLGLVLAIATTAGAAVDPLTLVTGPSPFAAGCNGALQTGTNYHNAEVEPWVDVNPASNDNLVGAWQQDRWSNGGSSGNLSGYSTDGGQSWAIPLISAAPNTGQPKFSRCTGGTAANGGDFERATDPWVSFSPNGVAHQIALGINDSNSTNAVLAARSTDGGANWSDPRTIQRDSGVFFDDKESITADSTNSNYVYATWQRIIAPSVHASARAGQRAGAFRSIPMFARSTDNGVSWEPARGLFDPGNKGQTIANQIVTLPSGELVMLYTRITNVGAPRRERGFRAEVLRSTDKGVSWSAPILIDRMFPAGVRDPADGHDVRTGDIAPDIAVDPNSGALYVVWQDARFTGREQIAFSKSADGGLTWSPTTRISKVGGINQAFTASVAVGTNGTVAVTHYDFRGDDPTATPPLTTNTWILRSTDGGDTFTEEAVGGPFDMTTAPDALGYFLGDYEGLAFAAGGVKPGFKPFFVRANDGNLVNRTDVFTTTTSP